MVRPDSNLDLAQRSSYREQQERHKHSLLRVSTYCVQMLGFMPTWVCICKPCTAQLRISLEELDITDVVPTLQCRAKTDCREACADAGKLAVVLSARLFGCHGHGSVVII